MKGKFVVIYKYALKIEDEQAVEMPAGARILTVQMQHGQPQLWALVEPGQPLQHRSIIVAGTGHPVHFSQDARHIGTFQMHEGALVFHVFEDC